MKLREVAILLSVVFTAFPEKSDCYQRSYELTYTVVRMRVTLTLCSAFVLLRVAGSRTGFKINQPHAEMNSKCLIGRPSYSIFIHQTDDANCRNCAFLDRILSSATPRAPSTDIIKMLRQIGTNLILVVKKMEDDKAETDVRSYSNTYHANKSWWHWILLFSRGFPLVFLFHEMLPFSYWLSRAHGPRAPIIIHGNGKHRVAWTKTVWALVLPAHVTGLPTHPSFLATEAGTRIPIGPSCGGGCRFPLWPHRPYPPPFIFPPNGAHINVIKAASCSVQFLRFSRISACDVITSEWASCNESSLACLFQFSSPTDRVITRRNSRKTTASDCPWKTRTWA